MEQLDSLKEEELFLKGIENQEEIDFLKEKFEEINQEDIYVLKEKKAIYYAGFRKLFHLVQKLKPNDRKKFWKEIDMSDLIFNINNITYITKVLGKFIFQMDYEAEALALIVTDYYTQIYSRIKRQNNE